MERMCLKMAFQFKDCSKITLGESFIRQLLKPNFKQR